jgi:hypothetical protein
LILKIVLLDDFAIDGCAVSQRVQLLIGCLEFPSNILAEAASLPPPRREEKGQWKIVVKLCPNLVNTKKRKFVNG